MWLAHVEDVRNACATFWLETLKCCMVEKCLETLWSVSSVLFFAKYAILLSLPAFRALAMFMFLGVGSHNLTQ